MRLHVRVKNGQRLPIISRRILHSKQWILRSPMPNENPESHYKSRRILGAANGEKFLAIWKQGIPSFWNLYSKSTVVQTLLQCGWWNFSPLPCLRDHQNRVFNSSHPPHSFLDPSSATQPFLASSHKAPPHKWLLRIKPHSFPFVFAV